MQVICSNDAPAGFCYVYYSDDQVRQQINILQTGSAQTAGGKGSSGPNGKAQTGDRRRPRPEACPSGQRIVCQPDCKCVDVRVHVTGSACEWLCCSLSCYVHGSPAELQMSRFGSRHPAGVPVHRQASCFPGSAHAEVQGRGRVTMTDLMVSAPPIATVHMERWHSIEAACSSAHKLSAAWWQVPSSNNIRRYAPQVGDRVLTINPQGSAIYEPV
jgi:hypothetical protein